MKRYVYLMEKGREGVDRINLAQDREWRLAFGNTVMNLCGKFGWLCYYQLL
jgi:hypothetical protein